MLLDTPICDFGWKAPDFNLPDAKGRSFSLTSEMGENGLVIAFICNHCPYVKAVINRLVEDANELKQHGINFVAIMSNDYQTHPDDHPEKMIDFAEKHKMEFPYLVDKNQSVAKAYGAICTPDFFGFNKNGELQYRGRIDDKGLEDGEGRVSELLGAMKMVAQQGVGPQQQNPSMGCSIKWMD